MYPIFGMYSVHKLHVHRFVLFLDKSILNVSKFSTDFISFGILTSALQCLATI